MPDLDLLELLSADHVNLQADVTGPEAVSAIEKHLTVERALLYPTLESHLDDGRHVAARLRTIDNTLVDALRKPDRAAADDDLTAALQEHIRAQESHYAQLREVVPAKKLQELGDQLPLVMEEAPTRLHPHLPDHGPLREVTSELAAAADQLHKNT